MPDLDPLRRKETELADLLAKIRRITGGAPGRGVSPGDRAYWEMRKVEAQALQIGIHRRRIEGELVPRGEAAQLAARRTVCAKNLLEQIPDRMLGLLPKQTTAAARKSLRARVAEMIEDVLTALAEEAETGYGPDENDGDRQSVEA